jgi:hypothetical protein
MRHGRNAHLVLGLVVATTVPARADDAADARALVEKAIKAQGGADKLEKFTATVVKFKGEFHGMGEAIPMTGEVYAQGSDKHKLDAEVAVGGQKFRIVTVLAGDKGWARFGDDTTEMDKDQLAEGLEQAYAGWVATLVPLKDKAFTLATTGESMVEKRVALGVKVSRKGHRDVTLYFDKATGLLIKTEGTVKDEGSGQEVTEETFLDGYKEVQGTKQAMKFTVKRDGKLFLEGEATEIELVEKLGDDVFAKP